MIAPSHKQDDRNALQLAIWRETGHHIQIEEAIQPIANILAEHLSVDGVVIQRIDETRSCIETAGAVAYSKGVSLKRGRADVPRVELDRLVRWCRRGELVRIAKGSSPPKTLPNLGIADLKGEAIVAGLSHKGHALGVIVLINESSTPFTERDRSILQTLLEPFAVALENDRRVRELATLREAAEADKRSLLTRLGRDDLTETIIGAQGGLRLVIERVDLVAKSDVPVLILGETGSGKEVIARAIHTRSARHAGPFMRVNCGAIPPGLIDSELFGHERGSFTGATATRQGWFERADGGTLFLDEIGELPPAAQVRLLRILQDGTFERVGGGKQMTINVRVVAATHRDLPAMIDEGKFREDLWYRIAVFPVRLPPLRERTVDIPAMATHFAVKAARRFGLPALAPSPEDVRLLTSYEWPGNVRELSAVMDRAAILGGGQRLEVAAALGQGLKTPRQLSQPAPSPAPALSDVNAQGSITSLDQAMARHIEQALQMTYGRVEGPYGAARLLGINPHTLRARMRKLGVSWRKYRKADD
jgi:transcriptional regulator with GAF, ATPase, and Fis domain